tara:strand:- start:1324 stop:1566 length:243 start_codon:yes stop_codon:yes gene_type:complete
MCKAEDVVEYFENNTEFEQTKGQPCDLKLKVVSSQEVSYDEVSLSETLEEENDAAAQWLAKAERLLPVIIPGQAANSCFS